MASKRKVTKIVTPVAGTSKSNKKTATAVASDGAHPFSTIIDCMYGPNSVAYALPQWDPTWVPLTDLDYDEEKMNDFPQIRPYSPKSWEMCESGLSSNNFKMKESKFLCRWCGAGSNDKSNINRHERKCNALGEPKHIHDFTKPAPYGCKVGCKVAVVYTPREDGRHQNERRPVGSKTKSTKK
uniref:C2H2-type domain-containing protein n=1 Tax=Tetranychus urticae TaxID=32264 RepID=T1KVI5_TETUR